MNNYLVRAASMEGVRATIASLGGDADSLQMIFRADILDRPLSNADPGLHRLLEEHLSSLKSTYPDDYCGQVRHLIGQAAHHRRLK
jgi:hypothetical protein